MLYSLLREARADVGSVGFIRSATGARLTALNVDVAALEQRLIAGRA